MKKKSINIKELYGLISDIKFDLHLSIYQCNKDRIEIKDTPKGMNKYICLGENKYIDIGTEDVVWDKTFRSEGK